MKNANAKDGRRIRRKQHIRKAISGTADRPRMTVFRSNRHMYVQVIDDAAGVTLASASTMESDFKALENKVEDAAKLGEAIGQRCKDKKISTVVFDRNGFRYHGIVKAIADGARKSGLEF